MKLTETVTDFASQVGIDLDVSANWPRPQSLDLFLEQSSNAPQWLIPDLIPADAFVILSGQMKRGHKTFFALASAISINRNVSLVVNDNRFIPQVTGPVLIIEEEGARSRMQERIRALCYGYQVDPSSLNSIFMYFRQRIKLDLRSHVTGLLAVVREIQPKLIIIDTLAEVMSGDENKVPDVARVIHAAQDLRETGSSVMLLCHLDKQRGEDRHGELDMQVRGSSAMVGAYDAHIAMRKYHNAAKHINMTVRSRDTEEITGEVTWQFETAISQQTGNKFTKSAKLLIGPLSSSIPTDPPIPDLPLSPSASDIASLTRGHRRPSMRIVDRGMTETDLLAHPPPRSGSTPRSQTTGTRITDHTLLGDALAATLITAHSRGTLSDHDVRAAVRALPPGQRMSVESACLCWGAPPDVAVWVARELATTGYITLDADGMLTRSDPA